MTMPHTGEDLRYVADILEALNKVPKSGLNIGVGGEVEVFWCDKVMGLLGLDDANNLQSWVYYPAVTILYGSGKK